MEKQNTGNISIPIEGMTCAACAQRIEKAIRKLDGIESVSVNFAAEKASVAYDPQKIRAQAVREAIEKAGYKALEVSRNSAADEDKKRKDKEISTLWIKFIVAAAFGLPLLYVCMAPMFAFANRRSQGALTPAPIRCASPCFS